MKVNNNSIDFKIYECMNMYDLKFKLINDRIKIK